MILFGGEWYDGERDKTHVYSVRGVGGRALMGCRDCWQRMLVGGAGGVRRSLTPPCPCASHTQDVYVLNVEKQTWKKVVSPNGCGWWQGAVQQAAAALFQLHHVPRCAPAGVAGRCRARATRRRAPAPRCGCGAASSRRSTRCQAGSVEGGGRGGGIVWGCPACVPARLHSAAAAWPPAAPACAAQEKFRHYSDLWRLNLGDWTWEAIPSKGGPSPRSGHRMVLHGKRILLFGGFYDSGKDTR